MTKKSTVTGRADTAQWWVLGMAVAACLLTFVTLWSLALQLAALGVSIVFLTRRPTPQEREVLIIAVVVVAVTVVATLTAASVAAFTVGDTFDGTSTLIGGVP